ncbi:MAG: phosphotransferase, partial [Proteobacteria bacterium]|nr:phosphotransferase [Pseudomonadota bacterium]
MAAFPQTAEELTTDWLSEKLGCQVSGFDIEPLGEGGGLLGLVTRIHLRSDTGPETLIAKFPTLTPENRAVATTYNMYGREYAFYTSVAPNVPLRAPRCYHADFTPETSDFVLLLEDLKGYRLGDQVAGCNLAEAHQVIESLAGLHRSTWLPNAIEGINQHDMPYQREGMIGGFQVGWPVVCDQFAHLLDPAVIPVLGKMPDQVNSLLDRIHDGPLVIAHGDVRLDNIFFSDSEIALVDFQAVCKAAPEHDLAYFVTQSL